MRIVHSFAAYIMRGRLPAISVTATCAVLSLVVFPLGQLSAACLALVTLRRGPLDGAVIAAGAAAVIVALGAVTGQVSTAVTFLVLYLGLIWGPVWLVSAVLRYTRSLETALVTACALGIVVVVGLHAYVGDVMEWWTRLLTQVLTPLLNGSDLSPAQGRRLIAGMASQMTGSLAAGLVLGIMVSVFIARWWQAMLYYPGGFRSEFHALRLGRGVAVAAAAIGILTVVPVDGLTAVSRDVFTVVAAAYLLHGLALMHTLVGASGVGAGWLIAGYVALIALPPTRLLLAALGFADSWMNLRGRLPRRRRRDGDTHS